MRRIARDAGFFLLGAAAMVGYAFLYPNDAASLLLIAVCEAGGCK
jgi:hypothetical protein